MDKTVPPGAAHALDFIGSIEAPRGYDTVFGNNQSKLPKKLTSMTLGEIQASQKSWTNAFGSSACGRYQFMRATLAGLIEELNLPLSLKLDANLQDRLAYHLLRRRGYDAFVFGKITWTEFAERLAQEWASLPVVMDTRGAHRIVKRGQSYYAGDNLNKSLVSANKVEAMLKQVIKLHGTKPDAMRVKPPKTVQTVTTTAAATGAAIVVAADPAGVVKTITDTVAAIEPAIGTVKEFFSLGGTVVFSILGVAAVIGAGYWIYTRFRS